jgi:hypothetical protein
VNEEVLRILREKWGETQALALSELVGAGLPWGDDGCGSEWRRSRLHDVCSSHGWDKTTLQGQLSFIAYDLKVCLAKISQQLQAAKTIAEAKEAAAPYFAKLEEGRV